MRRFAIPVVLFLLCLALPASLAGKGRKPTPMAGMNRVFVGWVDVNPEPYYNMGYNTKEEYEDVILHENLKFQETLKRKCASGRTIVGAKHSLDENTAGNDLFIKFFGVFYSKKYVLDLSVHLIDLNTSTEVAAIPMKDYSAGLCTLESCLEKELDQVNRALQKELQCEQAGK